MKLEVMSGSTKITRTLHGPCDDVRAEAELADLRHRANQLDGKKEPRHVESD